MTNLQLRIPSDLESRVDTPDVIGAAPKEASQILRGNSKEYVIFVTDGNPELQAAANYLQEHVGVIRTYLQEREKRSRSGKQPQLPTVEILPIPDVNAAIRAFYANPIDVALIIAQKRGPETSGRRIRYLLEDFDHLVWTGVVDAYTVRDAGRPNDTGYRVNEINPEQLIDTVALELNEMRSLFRQPVYRLSENDRKDLAASRRRTIDQILLEHGDYIILGQNTQKDTSDVGQMDTPMWITSVMIALRVGDVDTATARWQRAKKGMDTLGQYGITTFGLDQSIAGGYRVGDLTKLEQRGKPVFGLKRTITFEEAEAYKSATDFHLNLAERNRIAAGVSKSRITKHMLQTANLNVPRVIGVLNDEKSSGVVFMEYKGLCIYPISILAPGTPNILQELIDKAEQGGEGGKLASDLIDMTFVKAATKAGFWRANPFTELQPSTVQAQPEYYSSREKKLVSQASLFGITLSEAQLDRIGSFFNYLNSQLKLGPEDLALRMDLRVEHLGYDVNEKLRPTAEDILSATQNGGRIEPQFVDQGLVFYDTGGVMTLVPLHHEISHLKEHPLTRWTKSQTQRYTAIALASQQMFESLKRKNGAQKWHETLSSIIDTPAEAFNAQTVARDIPSLAYFGPNETIIDIYRDLEEARQILAMRLPRIFIRQDGQRLATEQTGLLQQTLEARTQQYTYYVDRALQHLSTELPEYLQLPSAQQANYELVRDTLRGMRDTKVIPRKDITALWDGF